MPEFNTTAIVLRRIHFGETDNILTLYTRERGRISAIAKGARKAISRLSGATEVLTRVRYGLASGKSLHIIRQAEVSDSYPMLRQDLNRLAHGLYAAELLNAFVADEDPNWYFFDLLSETLRALETSEPIEKAARWYELRLLEDQGYSPGLASCATCGRPIPGAFAPEELFALSNAQGGALCPFHAHGDRYEDHSTLSHDALVYLQCLNGMTLEDVSRIAEIEAPATKSQDQTRTALRRYLRYRSDRDLRSLEFLDNLRFQSREDDTEDQQTKTGE
jgi:DNA repair protein RecO (recombination protein O)